MGLVDTKPVTDLLNEVGTGQWEVVESPGEVSWEVPSCQHAKLTPCTSRKCFAMSEVSEHWKYNVLQVLLSRLM